MPLPQRAKIRVATVNELENIAATLPAGTDWPPPHMHVVDRFDDSGLIPGLADGSVGELVSDGTPFPTTGFWWTTLAELLIDVPGWQVRVGVRLLELYLDLNPTWVGPVASIPVFYEAGQGEIMRWISTVFRGVLGGGVEQFQWGLQLGNPGNDPDITEAQGLALAEQLAGIWAPHFTAMAGYFPLDVQYSEVGVVQKTQTQNTNSDGTGGNLSQDWLTQFWGWPAVSMPRGDSGTVTLPYEVACALTLHTDHRGPSGRGRVYMPPFSVGNVVAGGRFTGNTVVAVGAAFGAFLGDIKDETPYVPVVVSRRRGILNEINMLDVGGVPDSQRRRRRSQDEARVVAWTAS